MPWAHEIDLCNADRSSIPTRRLSVCNRVSRSIVTIMAAAHEIDLCSAERASIPTLRLSVCYGLEEVGTKQRRNHGICTRERRLHCQDSLHSVSGWLAWAEEKVFLILKSWEMKHAELGGGSGTNYRDFARAECLQCRVSHEYENVHRNNERLRHKRKSKSSHGTWCNHNECLQCIRTARYNFVSELKGN